MYRFLRSSQGGLGVSSVSLQARTTAATRFPKLRPDVVQPGRPTAVFDRVVQQGRDGLVLVATVLEHESTHGENVGYVGHRRTLPAPARP